MNTCLTTVWTLPRLSPSQHDSVYFSANLSDLDSVDAAFDLSYIKNQTLISYAAMPIFTAFEEQPITISAENQFNPFGEDITDARIRLSGLGAADPGKPIANTARSCFIDGWIGSG